MYAILKLSVSWPKDEQDSYPWTRCWRTEGCQEFYENLLVMSSAVIPDFHRLHNRGDLLEEIGEHQITIKLLRNISLALISEILLRKSSNPLVSRCLSCECLARYKMTQRCPERNHPTVCSVWFQLHSSCRSIEDLKCDVKSFLCLFPF